QLIRTERYGLYHLTSSGECSWYQFAAKIFELTGVSAKLEPTTTTSFGATARRPTYSVLRHKALLAAGLPEMRFWPVALAAYLAQRQTR
ncbi:MAG: sugar nucleotide-binding protein, partial [Anaerolineae bacterium]|nr:sugar nucleotide-binding protein [Anaerolineae bacterium]